MNDELFVFGENYDTCTLLGVPHAFMTRTGRPPFSYKYAAEQIHSDRVRVIDGTETDAWSGDGFVTVTPGVGIGVRTADCVPILFADREAGVIGAVHAGWRGTAARIAQKCVGVMCGHGADPARIIAVIGPCIHACCYEVREDFRAAFAAQLGDDMAARYITVRQDGRLCADLPAVNTALLTDAGLTPDHIAVHPHCTCCHTDRFFSFRGDGRLVGTMYAAIRLPDAPQG